MRGPEEPDLDHVAESMDARRGGPVAPRPSVAGVPLATRPDTRAALGLLATLGAILVFVAALLSACTAGGGPVDALAGPASSDTVAATPGAGPPAPMPEGPSAGSPAPTSGAASLHERVMAARPSPSEATEAAQPAAPAADPQSLSTAEATAPVEPSPAPPATTATVFTGGQTPLKGVWSGSADRLASFLLADSPSPRFTVPTLRLAEHYVRYSAEAGLRADVLWAQMIHETGYGRYGGDVLPEQNNYAGIGATGGGAQGVYFSSAEGGVIAHIAHMVAYVYTSSPVPWASAASDPRFDAVNPRGAASTLADLNGRWAVPGHTYGQAIEEIVRRINAR